jgi:hypothetical protein
MVLAVVALAFLGLGCTQVQADGLDRRIGVKPGGLLQVDLDLGEEVRPGRVSLEVRSHDADEVWAVADLSGLGASSVKFRLEHDERVVRLYGRSGGLVSWIFGGPGVSVRIWVPRHFSVDLRSASGPIRIEDVTGGIRARTRDASIAVEGAEGSLDLRTRAGAVRATEVLGNVEVRAFEGKVALSWVNGDVDVRTGRGDIRLRHIDGSVSLRTDNGEIRIEEIRGVADAKTERGAIYTSFAAAPRGLLETRRGSIEVLFPEHFGIELDAQARRGTVEVGAGVEVDGSRSADRFVGEVNGGGDPLTVYTARGSIHLDRR